MTKRNASSVIEPNYTHKWKKVEEWNGLVKGDPIKVSNERGDWIFLNAHDLDGEIIAVFVFGGPYGRKSTRAFCPEKVSVPPVKKTRKRKESLDTDQ